MQLLAFNCFPSAGWGKWCWHIVSSAQKKNAKPPHTQYQHQIPLNKPWTFSLSKFPPWRCQACREASRERIQPPKQPGCHYEIPVSPHPIFNSVLSRVTATKPGFMYVRVCVCLHVRVNLKLCIRANCLAACLRHISYMLPDYRPCQVIFHGTAVESSGP